MSLCTAREESTNLLLRHFVCQSNTLPADVMNVDCLSVNLMELKWNVVPGKRKFFSSAFCAHGLSLLGSPCVWMLSEMYVATHGPSFVKKMLWPQTVWVSVLVPCLGGEARPHVLLFGLCLLIIMVPGHGISDSCFLTRTIR